MCACVCVYACLGECILSFNPEWKKTNTRKRKKREEKEEKEKEKELQSRVPAYEVRLGQTKTFSLRRVESLAQIAAG